MRGGVVNHGGLRLEWHGVRGYKKRDGREEVRRTSLSSTADLRERSKISTAYSWVGFTQLFQRIAMRTKGRLSYVNYRIQQIEIQPWMADNPACGPLDRETYFSVPVRASGNLVLRDSLGRPIPCVSPFILHTLAESGAYPRAPLLSPALR